MGDKSMGQRGGAAGRQVLKAVLVLLLPLLPLSRSATRALA
jgi:hypothetical protein